mmetsp:Transcript_55308/g.131937  ORF Transcript_55308/g.131937 Transcript_55308/m.131937 type:complete len:540 (-) Transcript_55308:105-1724(-)
MALPVDFWRHDQMLNIFRSKPCQRLSRDGTCEWRSQCQYSHCLEWPRRPPHKHPYQPDICPHMQKKSSKDWGGSSKAVCPEGAKCSKAHSKDEVLYHPLIFKTTLCEEYHGQSNPQRGAKIAARAKCHRFYCPFAHGDQELRQSPLSREERQAFIQSAKDNFPSSECCKVCPPDQVTRSNGEASMWSMQVGEDAGRKQSVGTADAPPKRDPNNGSKEALPQGESFNGGIAQASASMPQGMSTAQGMHGVPAPVPFMVQWVPVAPALAMAMPAGSCAPSSAPGTPAKGASMQVATPDGRSASQDGCFAPSPWNQASYMTPYAMMPYGPCGQSPMPGQAQGWEYYDPSGMQCFPPVPAFPVQAQGSEAIYPQQIMQDMYGNPMQNQGYYWSPEAPKVSEAEMHEASGYMVYPGQCFHGGMMAPSNGYHPAGNAGVSSSPQNDTKSAGSMANGDTVVSRASRWVETATELLKEHNPPVVTLTELHSRLMDKELSADFDEPGSLNLGRLADELQAWPQHFAVKGQHVTLAHCNNTPEVMQVMG